MDPQRLRSKLWTPEDLADYLCVPVGWIYKRTRKGGPELIPHIKLGKYLRFDPDSAAFREWLASHNQLSAVLSESIGDRLTLASPVHRVRATEKTGQILTKGESVYGS